MLVSLETYRTLIGAGQSDSLLTEALGTAQSIIEEHLEYSLESSTRTRSFDGFIDRALPLPGYFITKVETVALNGNKLPADAYSLDGYFLVLVSPPARSDALVVAYTAGLTQDTVPQSITLAISLIAQALLANVGSAGIATNINYGAGGAISLDPSRYYKYFDLVDRYREAV